MNDQVKLKNKSIIQLLLTLVIAVGFFSFSSDASISSEETVLDSTTYVVQVKKHTNVNVINSFKKQLMAKYSDKKFVTTVQPPNYILSIGYFATEAEATEFKNSLVKEFPDAQVLPYEKK